MNTFCALLSNIMFFGAIVLVSLLPIWTARLAYKYLNTKYIGYIKRYILINLLFVLLGFSIIFTNYSFVGAIVDSVMLFIGYIAFWNLMLAIWYWETAKRYKFLLAFIVAPLLIFNLLIVTGTPFYAISITKGRLVTVGNGYTVYYCANYGVFDDGGKVSMISKRLDYLPFMEKRIGAVNIFEKDFYIEIDSTDNNNKVVLFKQGIKTIDSIKVI